MSFIEHWNKTFGKGDTLLFELVHRYSEPHRFYHRLSHLEHCFEVLNRYFPDAPNVVSMAIWFHDYVYDPKDKDNEDRSASAARYHVPPELADEVEALILCTKIHRGEGRNAQILLDVDLAILAETPEVFDTYEENIRKEYSWVPEADYREGRTKLLRGFLDRESSDVGAVS